MGTLLRRAARADSPGRSEPSHRPAPAPPPGLRRPTSRLVSATPPPVADPRRPVGQPRLATDAGSSFPTPARRSCTLATRSGHGRLSGDQSSALSPAPHQPRSQSFVPHASRSEEHTSELQSRQYLVCRLLLEKKKQN